MKLVEQFPAQLRLCLPRQEILRLCRRKAVLVVLRALEVAAVRAAFPALQCPRSLMGLPRRGRAPEVVECQRLYLRFPLVQRLTLVVDRLHPFRWCRAGVGQVLRRVTAVVRVLVTEQEAALCCHQGEVEAEAGLLVDTASCSGVSRRQTPDTESSSELPNLATSVSDGQGVSLTTVTLSHLPARTASMTPAVSFIASASSARMVPSRM